MHITKEDRSSLWEAVVAALAIFIIFTMSTQVYAASTTLSVSVQTAISFSLVTNNFANLTPGTPAMATTSLIVTTNSSTGWNVVLSGDNKNTSNNNLQRTGETSVQIADATEWVPGAATSTAGNAVRISSLANSGNVLAFRVMTASSTNGAFFYSPSWWGAADNYATDNASTLYAGISSSTVSRMIGSAGVGSYSSSQHINDVQYYLNVAASQKTGTYTAGLTYTATGN